MVMVEGVERRTLEAGSAALTRIKANLGARAASLGKQAR
jgi:hypothetical protein